MDILFDIYGRYKPFREDTTKLIEVYNYHEDYIRLLASCEKAAYLIRNLAVYSMTCGALGHPGGTLSEADFLATLYNYILRYNPHDPKWENRDLFYFSKCHACPGLYAALSLFGYFPVEWLKNYGTWGSRIESHPDHKKTPGVEISGGSLGQIAGVAVGRALGIKIKGSNHNSRMVYVMLGDGECEEGSVWEALMSAGHYRLDNLVFIIDYNKVQAKGFVKDEMSLEPLADKLRAFNLDIWIVDNGHNISQIVDTFNSIRTNRRGKPHAVILNTVKGYQVEICEYNPNWHTSAPRSVEQARGWLREMWWKNGRRLGMGEDFPERLANAIQVSEPLHENPDAVKDNQA